MSTTSPTDRAVTGDGSRASKTDTAANDRLPDEDRRVDTPHARGAAPLPKDKKHDQLAEKAEEAENRQEALLDEALEETFPNSDPISPKHIT